MVQCVKTIRAVGGRQGGGSQSWRERGMWGRPGAGEPSTHSWWAFLGWWSREYVARAELKTSR